MEKILQVWSFGHVTEGRSIYSNRHCITLIKQSNTCDTLIEYLYIGVSADLF